MNTLTPTSEPTPQSLGLPDVATLTRLAGEFFAALPGAVAGNQGLLPPLPTPALPGGSAPGPLANGPQLPGTVAPGANVVPTSPLSLQALGASTPSLAPHAVASNGLPDQAVIVLPALDGSVGGQALGVPAVYAPAAAGQPAGAATGASYYFLGDGAAPFYFVAAQPDPHGYGGRVPGVEAARRPPFDVHAVRRDFPILQERVKGKPLVWLDNAATTQKPRAVIDRLSYFYEHENSNIHRAAHELAARATDAYEGARNTVARFLGAALPEEIIFVRGATEAINLVAKTWGVQNVGEGDEIIVSHLEHHANIVPWQQLAVEKGARLRVIPVDDSGQVLISEYKKLLGPRTKIVAVTQVSNALGTVVPVSEIVALAHQAGAVALVDGAQSVSHLQVDVQSLDADFFVFSGHKIFGPTGIGVVYGKRALLEQMPPWQGGGNMIADVTFEKTVYHGPPTRFEAGTGNIADAVGLGAALDYVKRLGLEAIAAYEHELLAYATAGLHTVPGLHLVGTARDKASVLSFVLDGYATEQVGRALNDEGIAVRSGHHCAQPILRRFGLEATVRPSLAFYNTCEEVDLLVRTLRRLAGRR